MVVWVDHNDLGNARYTDITIEMNLHLGQLCRETFGINSVLILGCSTYQWTVAAADHWDGDMKVMKVKPSRRNSWEIPAHSTSLAHFVLNFRAEVRDVEFQQEMARKLLFRHIGKF